MAIDTTTPRTRRALLTAAVGGAAAAAAAVVARVAPTSAADGDTVLVGGSYHANSRTSIQMNGQGNGAFWGTNSQDGYGLAGSSTDGSGLLGWSTNAHAIHLAGGRIKVDGASGIATINAGAKKVVIKPGFDINPKTFFVLTPEADIGDRSLWYTKNGNKDQFAIRMSRQRGKSTRIAWLAIERG